MSEVVQLMLALSLIIAIAKGMGYIATLLKQPAVLGELLAGVILGPTIFNLMAQEAIFHDHEAIEHLILELAELGVLLLMFAAGLEINLKHMMAVGKTAILAGIFGVVIPVVLMAIVMLQFDISNYEALFLGLVLAATSVSISAEVMMELGVLDSDEGTALLGAAVVDDILVVLLISIFIAINPGGVAETTESRSVAEVLIRLGIFIGVGFPIAWHVLPYIANLVSGMRVSEGDVTVAIVAALISGVAAEYIGGVAAITGAFMAGICLGRTRPDVHDDIEHGVHAISYALFVPIFFVSIGLQVNLRLLTLDLLPLALAMLAVAVFSKVFGAGLGSYLTGFDRHGAFRVGLGMISRGEVGLIVTSIGVSIGIITEEIFAAVIFVVLITTMMTPPLVRWSFQSKPAPPTKTDHLMLQSSAAD